ncbi:hypothetical protein WN990_11730 [Kitasatospora purpeofusca]
MAAANCGDALARHLPCRARDRNNDRSNEHNNGRTRRRNRSALDD